MTEAEFLIAVDESRNREDMIFAENWERRTIEIMRDLKELRQTENERRLRCIDEANKELDDCERDWQDRGEAARQPFARSEWDE